MRKLIMIALMMVGISASAQKRSEYHTYHVKKSWGLQLPKDWATIEDEWDKTFDKFRSTEITDIESYVNIFNQVVLNLFWISTSNPSYHLKKSNGEIIILKDLIPEVNVKFDTLGEGVIAIAESPKEGDDTIIVDPEKWIKLNTAEAMWTISHEIFHEVYGLEHGQGPIMFPIMPNLKYTKDEIGRIESAGPKYTKYVLKMKHHGKTATAQRAIKEQILYLLSKI